MATSPNIAAPWANLGNTLAGGNVLNGQLAEAKGESLGANTIDALAQARARVEQNTARENVGNYISKLVPDQNTAQGLTGVMQAGFDPTKISDYQKQAFETGQRLLASNPNTSDPAAARAIYSVQNNPDVLRMGANGEFQNILHPDQGIQETPLGSAIAGANIAEKNSAVTKNNADATAATSRSHASDILAQNGGRAPAGYQWSTDDQGVSQLAPIPGGPKDPAAKAAAPMGSREAAIFQRQLNSAAQSTNAIKSIMSMPSGATTGFLGVGSAPGHSPLQATVDTLRNATSSQDTQNYNTIIPGIDRSLATIETSGMVPPGTFTQGFGNLAFREGDSEETKLHKLAEMRQIVDTGMETAQNNPRVPTEQKAYIQQIRDNIKSAVPFTHADLFQLANDKQPGETLADVVKRRTGQTSSVTPAGAATAPAALPGLPDANAIDAELKRRGIQ